MLIKEIFQFIWMLFSSTKISSLRMKSMKHFPFTGYKYMMWCGTIIYRKSSTDFISINDVDLNHETIHLKQAQDCKCWLFYYISYLWNWIKGNPFAKNNQAYYINKYEVEAYAKEKDMTYPARRAVNNVRYFNTKENLKMFKRLNSLYMYKIDIRQRFKNI